MDKDQLIEALTREGNLCFPANKRMADILQEPLTRLKSETQEGATLWFEGDKSTPANIRIKIYPTGHRVFYNTFGRRFLMTDPEGNPLHEAEWEADEATHEIKLKQARCQLDCQQWVGIKPRAKKFSTHISIKGQPGWETMSLDQLRQGAAQAWQVPHSEVEYFYKDENFVATAEGEYDVNLLKDGLYALPGGTFETPVFISFMFGVQWEKLDLIPVVELFQSTLPGSGGAVFEFIWGLFEDQSRETPLTPSALPGTPHLPVERGVQYLSRHSSRQRVRRGQDIMDVFMDTDRSHEIEWTPRSDPPWRYFSTVQSMSLTVQDGYLYKLTLYDDPIGIPYINTARGGFGSCQRYMSVTDDQDHPARRERNNRKVPIAEVMARHRSDPGESAAISAVRLAAFFRRQCAGNRSGQNPAHRPLLPGRRSVDRRGLPATDGAGSDLSLHGKRNDDMESKVGGGRFGAGAYLRQCYFRMRRLHPRPRSDGAVWRSRIRGEERPAVVEFCCRAKNSWKTSGMLNF